MAALFATLRPGLADLRARIAEAERAAPAFAGSFPRDRQLALSRRLGDVLGYDWQAGRLDLAVHAGAFVSQLRAVGFTEFEVIPIEQLDLRSGALRRDGPGSTSVR